MDIKPILLFGMPRSGTTWLGKVFDSHPETQYRHEPDSGGVLDADIPLLPDIDDAGAYRDAVSRFIEALPSNHALRVTGKLPVFPKRYQADFAFHLRSALIPLAKVVSRWVDIREVPEFVQTRYQGPIHLVWKSIESLGRLGVMVRLLPQAHAVHIIRHPAGYVSSVLRGEAQGHLPGAVIASEDYGILQLLLDTEPARRRGLSMDYFRSLAPVERLAWRWLLFNEKAMLDLETMQNARTALYEDLCQNPLDNYRSLFEFAGLNWDKQTEQFLGASTQKKKSAYFSVFKDPKQAAVAWEQNLSEEDKDRIQAVVTGTLPGNLFGV